MKNSIKIMLLMLITSVSVVSQTYSKIVFDQKRTIFDKNFSVSEVSTFVANMENTIVKFRVSKNDKINISYVMEFSNYSKKSIDYLVGLQKLDAKKEGNKVAFTSKPNGYKARERYRFEMMIADRQRIRNKKKTIIQKVNRKSKDSLIAEINEPMWSKNRRLEGDMKMKQKVKKWKKSNKLYVSEMIIEIPSFVNLRLNIKNSKVEFEESLTNSTIIKSDNSKLNFKEIANNNNNFTINNGEFKAHFISSGSYTFSSVRTVIIAAVKEAILESEFSKIEIGEVGTNNTITDFNSEFFFYNWSKDFKTFNLNSEYSKIHFFNPEFNHSFKVFGNNTKNFIGKQEISTQPVEDGNKHLMIEHKRKENEHFSGDIYFDIINGIIYSYNNASTFGKNNKL